MTTKTLYCKVKQHICEVEYLSTSMRIIISMGVILLH